MAGHRYHLTIGLLSALLLASPVLAVPEVTTLGGGSASDDPVAACGDLAASPWEAGRNGRGLDDDQVFIDGAIAACEAALAADPQSAQAKAWLARAYNLAGRRDEAGLLAQSASDAGNAFASYLLSKWLEDSDYLHLAADAGFAPAQADLAKRYEDAGGVPGNYKKAWDLYQAAAAQNYGPAYYRLGQLQQYGMVDTADLDKAMTFYQQAADLGEPLGYNGIGHLYESGQGVAQDYAKAAEFYQLGADAGEKQSQTALAYLYEQGLGVPQDYDKSFALASAASAQDWGYAHASLALHYLFGEGTEVDEAKAFDLAWLAQRQGVAYAEGILGYMYQNGFGAVRDLSQARFHFEDGANKGDQYSADQIPTVDAELACADAAGSPYEPGNTGYGKSFMDIDPEQAIPACESAVNVNSGPVGNRVWLARAYARAERYQDAVPLLEEGVAAGNVLANTVLGDMLMAGTGVEQDTARAIGLYEAVAKDFGLAQFSLGMAYKEGIGVAEDREQALHWLRLAQSYGVAEADAELTALLSEGGEAESIDLTGFGREGPAY